MAGTADWTNWYNVKTDIDTGDVYYLYCSSICERGYNEYQGRAESFIRSGLESLVAELGFENVDYRQNGAETMHVELTRAGSSTSTTSAAISMRTPGPACSSTSP